MNERKLGFDRATLDGTIVEETDSVLTMRAVIARELVQDYPEGKSYKPADELEKAAWTGEGRWVATMEHPDTGLITRRSDVKGKMLNVTFRKDITDPKTKRPMVRGISADVTWFKDKVSKQMLDEVKAGSLKDVSIGFTFEQDDTPGTWEGQHYDFVQRNIMIDHLVAPCPIGRCPSPYCGIGVDSLLKVPVMGIDIEQINRHKLIQDDILAKMEEKDCPICARIKEVGLLESAKRLSMKFGTDVLTALADVPEGYTTSGVTIVTTDNTIGTGNYPVSISLESPTQTQPVNPPSPALPITTPPPAIPPVETPPVTTPEPTPLPPPVEESLPSVEELIRRTEETLDLMRRLNQKKTVP